MHHGNKGLVRYITCDVFRLREVFIVTGFPVFVAGVRLGGLAGTVTLSSLAEFTGYYFINLASWNMNSWLNYEEDLRNPRFVGLSGLAKSAFLCISLVAFVIAAALASRQSLVVLTAFIAYYGLWTLYSVPRWGLKYHSPWGTILHFGNMLILLLAASRTTAGIHISPEAIMLALLFAGGHIIHELIDHDSDKAERSRGTAVAHGKIFSCVAFVVVMTVVMAFALVAKIVGASALNTWPFVAATFLTIIVFLWQTAMLRMTDQKIFLRVRNAYRVLFGVAGIVSLWIIR